MLKQRFNEALEYATNLHSKQTRKDSEAPFIVHLLSVSALILEDGGSEDEAIAGLLHDAVEDQGGLIILEEIKAKFGDNVAGIILECSESHTHPKPPWKDRKMASISKMNNASDNAIRVILADKIHNARSIIHEYKKHGEKFWNSFKAGKEETVWYYKEILSVLKKKTSSVLLGELSQLVIRIENLQKSTSTSHLVNESKARNLQENYTGGTGRTSTSNEGSCQESQRSDETGRSPGELTQKTTSDESTESHETIHVDQVNMDVRQSAGPSSVTLQGGTVN